MKILAALQDRALESGLREQGNELLVVSSADDFERCRDAEPTFALVDEALPYAADLIVFCKAAIDGHDRDRLPVIALSNSAANGMVRCEPDATLNRPTAAQVVEAAREIILRRARQRRLFDQEVVLKIPSTHEQVDRAGDYVDQLVESLGYSPEDGVKLGMSIRESMGNAAEHGNKYDPSRTVIVNFLRSSDRVTIVITDEGPGFDTEAWLARADSVSALEHTRSRRGTEARPGGLGVFIMKETCDQITFNTPGNSIFLMKYLPGCKPS